MPADAPVEGPAERYRARRDAAAEEERRHAERGDRIANGRLFAFLAAAVLGLLSVDAEGTEAVGFAAAAGFFLLLFVALIVHHQRVRRRAERAGALREVSEAALARLARAWAELPVPDAADAGDAAAAPAAGPRAESAADHPYALDLDVLGRGSLLQLTDATATGPGRRTLAAWLLEPAAPAEVARRQEAVRELAPRLEWRDELAAEGRLASEPGAAELRAFLAWAAGGPWLGKRAWLRAAAWLVPATTLGLAALQLAGALARPWWLLSVGAAVAVSVWSQAAVHRTLERATAGGDGAGAYAPVLARLSAGGPFASTRLGELARSLAGTADGPAAPVALDRLRRLGHLADMRFSMLHFAFQYLLLWDLHVLRGLERWQRRAGARAADWIGTLGQVEALCSLAALADAHPGWAFPEAAEAGGSEPYRLEARELRHPLLRPGASVGNDVTLGPPGRVVLVTGANMSGKTTLLRAIGTNVVLAQAGAPVAAASFRSPPLAVWTSMRVEDSLQEGVSLFMAEIRRLKRIVDAARAPLGDGAAGRPVLYLLDELLRGTNPRERREGARRVLRLLTASPAIGAVSTHDLELGEEEELAGAAVPVHLGGRLAEGGELEFDYRLRSGYAPTTNALALMDRLGLRGTD